MKHLTRRVCASRRSQQGVVLIYALITLVIMLIGAVAISRSISANQFSLGNIGFKRDLTNQGERAIIVAMDAVRANGALANEAARNNDMVAANYSATMLPTNAQGIPTALLGDDDAFAAVGRPGNDIDVADMGVRIRYVIDRLTTSTGACTPSTCTMAGATSEVFGGAPTGNSRLAPPDQPIFRLTLRVTGPRNTLSFFQSTFTTD